MVYAEWETDLRRECGGKRRVNREWKWTYETSAG